MWVIEGPMQNFLLWDMKCERELRFEHTVSETKR